MSDAKGPVPCPQHDELTEFSAGRLPSDMVGKIGAHVEHCDKCAETISLMSESSDTLLTELRGSNQHTEMCSDADRDRVVQLINRVGTEASEAEKDDATKAHPVPAKLQKVVDDLAETGLLDANRIAEVITSLPEDKRDDPQEFAKALIRRKLLTKFQATAVCQGMAKSLVFGAYVVLDKIGAGGMGMVYRGQHRRMKREVAIKVLPGGSLNDDDAVERFYREVEAAAKLLHANIVTAFDAGQHGNSHFLVMEYVNGKDLGVVIRERGPLPVSAAVDLIIQAARGLEYAHGEGLIHRDIKPANLLVDKKGTVKILDMGLARLAAATTGDDGLTKSGQIMGTVDYMAPEQAADTRKADARSDIYSLGCTLYRLLTGQSMFDGETIMNKMMSHAQLPPPDLQIQRLDVSDQLNAVFQKMVAKSPADRQQSMSEVIADLHACIQDDTIQAASAHTIQTPGRHEASSDSQLTDFFDGIMPVEQSVSTTPKPAADEQTIDLQDSSKPDTKVEIAESSSVKAQALPQKEDSRRSRHIGLCLAGLAILLGVMVFFIRTSNGTVRIEILDPSLDVVFNSTGLLIKGDKKFEEIKLVPGKDRLKITRGEFEFYTDEFELKKGGDVVIRIEYFDGNVRVSKDGDSISVNSPRRSSIAQSDESAVPKRRVDWDDATTIRLSLAVAPFDVEQAKEHQSAWANHLGIPIKKEVKLSDGETMTFMLVPPGKFRMGAGDDDQLAAPNEKPQHPVTLTQPFYMAATEVTVGQFRQFVVDTKYVTSAEADGKGAFRVKGRTRAAECIWSDSADELPVRAVGWKDAQEFCDWLEDKTGNTYRLPTEAEWEYACRAGTTSAYWFGDEFVGEFASAFSGDESAIVIPGTYPANAFGLYEMHGNVHETCFDSGRVYTEQAVTDPVGKIADTVVVRGGAASSAASRLRSSHRYVADARFAPNASFATTVKGFRVIQVIDAISNVSGSSSTPPDRQ